MTLVVFISFVQLPSIHSIQSINQNKNNFGQFISKIAVAQLICPICGRKLYMYNFRCQFDSCGPTVSYKPWWSSLPIVPQLLLLFPSSVANTIIKLLRAFGYVAVFGNTAYTGRGVKC